MENLDLELFTKVPGTTILCRDLDSLLDSPVKIILAKDLNAKNPT